VIFLRLAILLTSGPLFDGYSDIAHQGRHLHAHSAPGQAQQQSVGGKCGKLGIGGHIGIAVDKVIAKKSVRAVVFPDLVQGFAVHGVAHGIAHGKTQQRTPKLCPFFHIFRLLSVLLKSIISVLGRKRKKNMGGLITLPCNTVIYM